MEPMMDQSQWLPPIDEMTLSEARGEALRCKEAYEGLLPVLRAYSFLMDVVGDLATSPDLPNVKEEKAKSAWRYALREFGGIEELVRKGI
jgi:hypothetical protein